MDFSIGASEFQRIIGMLGVVARVKSAELDGRLNIDAVDGRVFFSAYNGTNAIKFTTTPLDLSEPGGVSVVYGKIETFVKSFKPWAGSEGAKSFNFRSGDSEAEVSVSCFRDDAETITGRLRLAVAGLCPFQGMHPVNGGAFVLNSSVVKRALNKTMFAVDPKCGGELPALQGVNMKIVDDGIFFAGANGRILSEYRIDNHTGIDTKSVVLHYEFAMGLRRLLSDDTQIVWEVGGNRLAVEFENVLFVGKKMIGCEYPDYDRTFSLFKHRLDLDKNAITEALSPIIDLLEPEDNHRLTLEIDNSGIRFYNDQVSMVLQCDVPDGLSLVVDINGRLLAQGVESIADDTVAVKFSDDTGMLILDAVSTEDQKVAITPIMRRS